MAFRLTACWDGRWRAFELAPGENLVGSDAGSDVVLRHPGVSRRHAVLLVLGNAVEVADLGSENGTFADGRRLTKKTRFETDGSLAFGAVEARLEWLRDDDTQAALVPCVEETAAHDGVRPAAKRSDDIAAGTVTTASVGPLQLFALVYLPRLVEVLDHLEPGEVEPATRAAGDALAASLPCVRVEIARRGGVLYLGGISAAEPLEAAGELRAGATAGDLDFVVDFQSASSARLYAPILSTVARLVAMGVRRSAPAAMPAAASTAEAAVPPLPAPATVDPGVRAVFEQAARVADSDQHVLILGASGTGKELLARFVHRASPRRERPFVALNCAALPGDLLEAELFGIEKGVATGVDPRPGRFEQAHGGTLFLDEIGDMAPAVQSKILRVLQEKEVHRLGGLSSRPADVRVISATHQDLDALRADGRFRDDLYHRIADWRLRLPTLADRVVDIPNLASFFLTREARRRGVEARGVSRAALRVLCRHPWPGNIRQLEKEIAKAVLFVEDGGLLDTGCLDPELLGASPPQTTLREYLERVEAREICRALAATGNDVPRAAEDLGLPESTLYRKIRLLEIEDSPHGVPATARRGG